MLEAVSWFSLFIITHLLDCIVFNKIIEKRKFDLNFKRIIILAGVSIVDVYVNEAYGSAAKIVMTNLNSVMALKLIFNKPILKTLIYCIISYLTMAVVNIIGYGCFHYLIGISQEELMIMGIEFYGLNIVTYVGFMMVLCNKKVLGLQRRVLNWYDESEKINTIIFVLLGGTYIAELGYSLVVKNYNVEGFIRFTIIFIGSIVFVSGFFKQRSENNELKARYKASNDYAKTYERMATTKAKELHEHENQLVTMRGLADKKNQKLIDYIDKAIHKVAETEDQDYNHKLVNIPDGGLKGLIGYKIDTMLSEKMEVYVRVSDKLSEVSLWKNLENNLRDISMILGIYIDNAIEAARESKNKYIVIEVMYEEEEIVFEISNTYQEEVEEVGREGYTTKGIGRGNGLTLVRDIIDKNDRVRDEREVVGSYYVQKLIYQPK